LVEGKERDKFPAREAERGRGESAGKNYLDFFWKGRRETLTLASQKIRRENPSSALKLGRKQVL